MLKLRIYLIAWLLKDVQIPSVDTCRGWSLKAIDPNAKGDGWRFDQFMQGLRVAQPAAAHVSTYRHLVPESKDVGLPPLWQAILNEGLPGLEELEL